MINNLAQSMLASHEVSLSELTLEDRILKMIAEVAHRLEYLSQALVFADVVANQVSIPHVALLLIAQTCQQHSYSREQSQSMETSPTDANRAGNIYRATLAVAPRHFDMQAWKAPQVIRHHVAARQLNA
jgi:hypothetical protein